MFSVCPDENVLTLASLSLEVHSTDKSLTDFLINFTGQLYRPYINHFHLQMVRQSLNMLTQDGDFITLISLCLIVVLVFTLHLHTNKDTL